MNKSLLLGLAVFTVSAVIFTVVLPIQKQKQTDQQEIPVTSMSSSSSSVSSAVPLPNEESIIRTYFLFINEKKIAQAVLMMNPEVIKDDSIKQSWGVQLNAFQSVSVQSIEPSMKEEWTETRHSYKVVADVQMKPEAATAVIPNYGWENGTNTKWIELVKVDKAWRISGIASGP